MLLKLYSQDGNLKAELQANDSSTQDKEIQADNVLSLGFTLYQYVGIDVNDYVDYMGERYWVIERYQPEEKSSVEWEYNLQLYGIESLIRRFLVLNDNEAVFSLTAHPVDHLRLIVKCINEGMGNTTIFKVGSVEGTDNVVIDYTGKYCNEALKELADAVGVEYWFEDDTVNLCRCEFGDLVVIGYGMGLTNLEQDKADNVKFYTRLFPIGSSRNIDRESYGSSRLQLPGGVKYVDSEDLVQKYGIIHHYEQEAFSGIYPRRVGTVSTVRSEEVQDTNGNPFTIYYFKDDALPFDPNEYEIGGLVKHVSFQEGSELAGLGTDDDHYFEVNFNSETKEFEIITIWPYDDDRQLPGDTLVPKPGDKYILWNIRMPDEYYTLAETEFLNAVEGYNRKHILDVSRYKGPTDHVWIEDTGTELGVGRRVRLMSAEYFPELGYRDSRITRISRNVNLPSQMDLEISDALGNGTMAKIDDAINEAKSYAGSILGGVNVPDIIRSWDNKKPTDNNIYSARRSHKEFLSKQNDDTAYGRMTFDKESTFRNGFGSDNFSSGELGSGYHMGKYGNTNDSYLEIDRLLVRKMAYYVSLAIKRLDHVGGSVGVSPADLTISNVEVLDDVYRCYVDLTDGHSKINIEDWQVGDLARCQTFNVNQATYYWRAVDNVDYQNGYVDLSIEDCDAGSGIPKRGDVLVAVGNKTDATRQNFIEISSTGSSSPSIKIYHGIDSYSLDKKDATSFEYDPTTGRMKMVVYGDMYVGDRLQKNYIKYDQDGGVQMRVNSFSLRVTDSEGQTSYKAIDEIIEEIASQSDGAFLVWRSETYGEPSADSEPESEWTTDEVRDEHVGDIYLNAEGLAWEYKYNPVSGYFWQEVSDQYLIESLRRVKEKARCFAGTYGTDTPTSGDYSKNDLWVKATYQNSYTNDLLVCIRNGSWDSFNIADWAVATNYSKDIQDALDAINTFKKDVQEQVDGKANSYYQATDPSESWSNLDEHIGDLWYNTSTKTSSVWGKDETVQPIEYKWFESSVDLEPFVHKYDKKASIFYGSTVPQVPYSAHDFWVLEAPFTIGDKTYDTGTILVSLATRDENSESYATDWVDILKYTDGKALQVFIENTYNPFVQEISEQLDGVAESFVTTSTTDPSTNWTDEEKANHKGDIWVQENTGLSFYWTGARWIQSSISLNELTDKTDGKATIFIAKPENKRTNTDGEIIDDGYLYRKNDLWILGADTTLNGTLYEKGTIMVATTSNNGSTFNEAHWAKKDCYTNGMNDEDKQDLIDAGIDIVNGKIIATSDSFKFQNRQGTEVAVFEEVGGKGYLRTDLIHADEIVTNKVVARDADGHILSIYNGNGNGTIVYYYPDGTVMKEDLFTYTKDPTTGEDKISGMITRYYNPDGSIAWFVNQSGDVEKNLHYYWRSLGEHGVATSPSLSSLASLVRASWSTKIPTANIKKLCQFYSDTYDPNMYAYNGLTCYGNHSGVDPTHTSVVGTEVTGYVSETTTLEEDVFLDDSDNDVVLTGYYFEHFSNGKSDSISYFVATDGTVWNGETHRQVNV